MDSQNVTAPLLDNSSTPAPVVTYDTLDASKKTLVDYRALSGWVSTDDNELGLRKMSMDELASKLSVHRKTLYDWQNTIPNFWGLVNQRRSEISSESRLAAVEKIWLTKALKGDWQHLNAWLLNYKPNYKTPGVKVEHSITEDTADLIRELHSSKQPAMPDRVIIDANPIPNADNQQPNT